MKTKGKILRSIAKKRGWKIKEAKASKVKHSDMKGIPKLINPLPYRHIHFMDELIITPLEQFRAQMIATGLPAKYIDEFIKFLVVTGSASIHNGIIVITFK